MLHNSNEDQGRGTFPTAPQRDRSAEESGKEISPVRQYGCVLPAQPGLLFPWEPQFQSDILCFPANHDMKPWHCYGQIKPGYLRIWFIGAVDKYVN